MQKSLPPFVAAIAALLLLTGCGTDLPDIDLHGVEVASPLTTASAAPLEQERPPWQQNTSDRGSDDEPDSPDSPNQPNNGESTDFREETRIAKETLADLVLDEYDVIDTGVGIIEVAPIEGGYIELERSGFGNIRGIRCYIPFDPSSLPTDEDDDIPPGFQSMYGFAASRIGRALNENETALIHDSARAAVFVPDAIEFEIGGRWFYLSYFGGELCLQ